MNEARAQGTRSNCYRDAQPLELERRPRGVLEEEGLRVVPPCHCLAALSNWPAPPRTPTPRKALCTPTSLPPPPPCKAQLQQQRQRQRWLARRQRQWMHDGDVGIGDGRRDGNSNGNGGNGQSNGGGGGWRDGNSAGRRDGGARVTAMDGTAPMVSTMVRQQRWTATTATAMDNTMGP